MDESQKPPSAAPKTELPPPIKPDNVLDSIFRDDGPMPPAQFGLRALAFLLDFALIAAVASILIWKVALPQAHPNFGSEYYEYLDASRTWLQSQGFETWNDAMQAMLQVDSPDKPTPSHYLIEGFTYILELLTFIFWLYFALGEAIFAGSVGKRACRLTSVSTITLGKPSFFSGIVRGGIKTAALFFFFPFALMATLAPMWFNRRRQMGHDLVARTVVVDEKHMHANQVM